MSNLATITNNILADSGIDDINVVVTNGSYANPAWITSLAWTKITDRPTTLAGYGITDAYTQTQVNDLLAAKQNTLSLTTTGTSGAATLIGATLNIPIYQSVLTNPVTGTGTTNYIPKWINSSVIGNSAIEDDNSSIVITSRDLRITSSFDPQIYLTKTGAGAGTWRIMGSRNNDTFQFRIYDDVAAQDRFNIFSNGNVSVGSSTDNGYKLYNNGSFFGNGTGFFANLLSVGYSVTAEPFVQGHFYNTSTTVNTQYGGVLLSGIQQSHIRFQTGSNTWNAAGVKRWQIRVGNGDNQDRMGIFSWTKGDDIINFFASGNVSIGNESDAYKLDVTGTGNFNSDGVPLTLQGGGRALFFNVKSAPTAGNTGVTLRTDSGSYLSLATGTNPTRVGVVVDFNNNLGIQELPNASWWTSAKVLQINDSGALYDDGFSNTILANNSYYNGSGNVKFKSGYSARILQEISTGDTYFQVAGTGAGGTAASYDTAVRIFQNRDTYFYGDARIISNEPQIYLTKTGTDAGSWRILGSTGGTLRRFRIYDEDASADRFDIFSSGNVSIGNTTDSGVKLDVSGTGRFSGNVTINNTLTVTQSTAETGAIVATSGWSGTVNNPIINFGRLALAVAGAIGYDDPNTGLYIGTTTNHRFAIRTNNSDRLTISNAGAATFSSSVTANGTATFLGQFGNGNNVNEKVIQFLRASASTDIVNIQGVNAGVGAANIAMQALGGNVLIGTTTDNTLSRLQVLGSTWLGQNVNRGVYFADGGSYTSIVGLNQGVSSYNSIELRASGVDGQLFLTTAGKVGIGLLAPISTLSVSTTSDTTDLGSTGLTIGGSTTLTSGNVLMLNFTPIGAGSNRARAGIGCEVGADWGKGNLVFYTKDASSGAAMTTADERVRIGSDGLISYRTNSQPPVKDGLYANQVLITNSTGNYQRIRFDVNSQPYWGLTREGDTNNFLISGYIGSSWTDNNFKIFQATGNLALNGTGSDSGKRLQVFGDIGLGGTTYNWLLSNVSDNNWGFGMFNSGETYYPTVYFAATSGNGNDRGFRVRNVTTNTNVFFVNSVGNSTFTGSVTATSFFESSDSRIKTLLEDKLDYQAIANVTAKYYEKNGKIELGYFAQDFEALLPSAVSKNEDGYLNLSYREVHTAKIAMLEKEIKELKEQLKNK